MSDWKADLAANLAETAQQWAQERYEDRVKDIEESCQSPIEKKLVAHLLTVLSIDGTEEPGHFLPHNKPIGYEAAMALVDTHGQIDGAYFIEITRSLFPQCRLGFYRMDFFLAARLNFYEEKPTLRIAIECDGHDFHERTKEQAAHDRQRDRWLQAQGFTVLRFTGSEIHRDAEACAVEVREMIENWHDQYVRANTVARGAGV